MAADNWIGPFNFVSMTLVPPGHRNQTTFETRSGVDGVFVWLDATRGTPFEVVTTADTLNLLDAQLALRNYEDNIGALANVIHGGIPQDNQVAILDVRPVPEQVRQTLLGVGGRLGQSAGLIVARWTLITTDVAAT